MKTKEIILGDKFQFDKNQQKIFLKAFKQKKWTNKLYTKIRNMDLEILQKKLNKIGHKLEIELVDRKKK